MKRCLHNLWQDESGQDLAEYTLLMALVVIACIGAVTAVGGGVQNEIQGAATGFSAGVGGGGGP